MLNFRFDLNKCDIKPTKDEKLAINVNSANKNIIVLGDSLKLTNAPKGQKQSLLEQTSGQF